MFHCCVQFFVSRKHKFVFIRHPKSSSSAIIEAITKTFCAGETCTQFELAPMNNVIDAIWRVYFVFTWVRNPFARMVSIYNMMSSKYLYLRAGEDGKTVGDHCSIPFLRFSEDTNQLRSECHARGCCVYIPEYKQWIPWFVAAHVNDQSHAVFTTSGSSMVDFVGRTENIDEDWAALLKHFKRRNHARLRSMKFTSRKQTASTNSTEQCFGFDAISKMLSNTTMSNIARQYSRDLVLFGYV